MATPNTPEGWGLALDALKRWIEAGCPKPPEEYAFFKRLCERNENYKDRDGSSD